MGRTLLFAGLAEAPSDSGIFLISALGDRNARSVLQTAPRGSVPILSWSADGKQLAFLHHPEGSASNDAIGLSCSGAAHLFSELSAK
jgi:hypothetical protein